MFLVILDGGKIDFGGASSCRCSPKVQLKEKLEDVHNKDKHLGCTQLFRQLKAFLPDLTQTYSGIQIRACLFVTSIGEAMVSLIFMQITETFPDQR